MADTDVAAALAEMEDEPVTIESLSLLDHVRYRPANPRDIPACYAMEIALNPADEAASKSTLQYRQHHAAPYFRVAVLGDVEEGNEVVVGFICATRVLELKDSSILSTHDSSGPMLVIHSVIVHEHVRNQGFASDMMGDYVRVIKDRDDGVENLVLLAKAQSLAFYVNCGFTVTQPSPIKHGKDQWYELEMDVRLDKTRLKGYPYYVVDSFASLQIAGSGNPAAVVLLPPDFDIAKESTREWMKVVAMEFNLSETAFVWRYDETAAALQVEKDNKGEEQETADNNSVTTRDDESAGQELHYNIRYITCNGTELDLCGHATLASASVLLQTLPVKIKNDVSVVFHANKDILRALPYVEGSKTWMRNGRSMKITMDFPKKSLHDITAPADRSASLAMIRKAFSLSNTAENIIYLGVDEDYGDLLIHLTSAAFQLVGKTQDINYSALCEWDGYNRGVIICCHANQRIESSGGGCASDNNSIGSSGSDQEEVMVDFHSRFFGPKAGISEDPVTGSAHCTLGPYFATKLGSDRVRGKQMSRRGGIVDCIIKETRMEIVGTAVTTMSGSLKI